MIAGIYPCGVRGEGQSVTTAKWGLSFLVFLTILVGAMTRSGTFLVSAVLSVGAVAFFIVKSRRPRAGAWMNHLARVVGQLVRAG